MKLDIFSLCHFVLTHSTGFYLLYAFVTSNIALDLKSTQKMRIFSKVNEIFLVQWNFLINIVFMRKSRKSNVFQKPCVLSNWNFFIYSGHCLKWELLFPKLLPVISDSFSSFVLLRRMHQTVFIAFL